MGIRLGWVNKSHQERGSRTSSLCPVALKRQSQHCTTSRPHNPHLVVQVPRRRHAGADRTRQLRRSRVSAAAASLAPAPPPCRRSGGGPTSVDGAEGCPEGRRHPLEQGSNRQVQEGLEQGGMCGFKCGRKCGCEDFYCAPFDRLMLEHALTSPPVLSPEVRDHKTKTTGGMKGLQGRPESRNIRDPRDSRLDTFTLWTFPHSGSVQASAPTPTPPPSHRIHGSLRGRRGVELALPASASTTTTCRCPPHPPIPRGPHGRRHRRCHPRLCPAPLGPRPGRKELGLLRDSCQAASRGEGLGGRVVRALR